MFVRNVTQGGISIIVFLPVQLFLAAFVSLEIRRTIMKKFDHHINEYGEKETVPKDLKKLLNLQYLRLTNKTHSVGRHDLPELRCETEVIPDYIALYSHPADYHKTPNTAVAFYLYDNSFDGINGLYNAIYHNEEKLLKNFKERFKGVKFFISPDYSEMGDIDDIENNYRIKKARVVSLWLTLELGAIVIPSITYPTIESLEFYLNGLEECKVIAFSTMGYIDDEIEREFLKEAVKHTVDSLKLRTIVVFDICGDDIVAYEIFDYAISKGIDVVIPPNLMKIRNAARKRGAQNARIR